MDHSASRVRKSGDSLHTAAGFDPSVVQAALSITADGNAGAVTAVIIGAIGTGLPISLTAMIANIPVFAGATTWIVVDTLAKTVIPSCPPRAGIFVELATSFPTIVVFTPGTARSRPVHALIEERIVKLARSAEQSRRRKGIVYARVGSIVIIGIRRTLCLTVLNAISKSVVVVIPGRANRLCRLSWWFSHANTVLMVGRALTILNAQRETINSGCCKGPLQDDRLSVGSIRDLCPVRQSSIIKSDRDGRTIETFSIGAKSLAVQMTDLTRLQGINIRKARIGQIAIIRGLETDIGHRCIVGGIYSLQIRTPLTSVVRASENHGVRLRRVLQAEARR